MLAGEGAVAIWNGISDEGRADFYAWHLSEHMPERVGIPGFLRGRRYRAADDKTHPEFFTLYETQTFEVTQGAGLFEPVKRANRMDEARHRSLQDDIPFANSCCRKLRCGLGRRASYFALRYS